MEQKTASDGGEVDTYNLEVSAETIINGLKINDRSGEKRTVLFRKQAGGGRGEGTLRDVRGLHWDGEAPIQLRPRAFVADHLTNPSETERVSREIAREDGEDPEEYVEEIREVWENDVRASLEDEIAVEPRFPEETKTVYRIDYVEDDE